MKAIKLLDSVTANGNSYAIGTGHIGRWVSATEGISPDSPDVLVERILLFSGTIGGADLVIVRSPDNGTTVVPTGKSWTSGDTDPIVITLAQSESVGVQVTGASGTTATTWLA